MLLPRDGTLPVIGVRPPFHCRCGNLAEAIKGRLAPGQRFAAAFGDSGPCLPIGFRWVPTVPANELEPIRSDSLPIETEAPEVRLM